MASISYSCASFCPMHILVSGIYIELPKKDSIFGSPTSDPTNMFTNPAISISYFLHSSKGTTSPLGKQGIALCSAFISSAIPLINSMFSGLCRISAREVIVFLPACQSASHKAEENASSPCKSPRPCFASAIINAHEPQYLHNEAVSRHLPCIRLKQTQ